MGQTFSILGKDNVVVSYYSPVVERQQLSNVCFQSLPAEVILVIVKLTGTPLKMSLVCSRIRQLSLSHASLWRLVDLRTCRGIGRLPFFLIRSGDMLLDIYLSLKGHSRVHKWASEDHQDVECNLGHIFPPTSFPGIFPVLVSHFYRTKSLTLILDVTEEDEEWLWEKLASFDHAAPDLCTLSIYGLPFSHRPFPPNFLSTSLPGIHHLTFNGSIAWIPLFRSWWSTNTLTHLKLIIEPTTIRFHDYVDVFDLLAAHAHVLEELDVGISPCSWSGDYHFLPLASPPNSVEFPALKRLYLRDVISPVYSINASSLESFHLDSPVLLAGVGYIPRTYASKTHCLDARIHLVEFLQRHSHTLINMSLHLQCDHDAPHPSMDAAIITFPKLITLVIETSQDFDQQPVTIIAPTLITFKYIPRLHRPCRDLFRFSNQYSGSLRYLHIDARKTSPRIDCYSAIAPPADFPELYRIIVESQEHTDVHELLRKVAYSWGPVHLTPFLRHFGSKFCWTSISDSYGKLTLDGTVSGASELVVPFFSYILVDALPL